MSPKRGSLAGLQPAPAAVPSLPARPAASPAPEVRTPVQQTSEVRTPEVQSTEVQSRVDGDQTRRSRRPPERPAVPSARTPASSPGLPKYLRLERKELLIWPEQITNLSILARVLNRNRGGAGERITTNTLIRVAAALLLSRSQELAGTTEEELRRSLGLPDLQTLYLRSPRQATRSAMLERMIDKRPEADRLLVAEIYGEARRQARWRELSGDEEAAAVAELRKLAGGRADLLAEVAGLLEGTSEGELDEPIARQTAQLCRKAGADEFAISAWIEEGRRRASAARMPPFSGGLR